MTALTRGQFTVDTAKKSAHLKGKPLCLSPTSFNLLVCLMQKAPSIVSIDELLDEVWPEKVVNRESVKQQIKSLRKQLGEEARLIESVRGYGYRLNMTQTEIPINPQISTVSVSHLSLVWQVLVTQWKIVSFVLLAFMAMVLVWQQNIPKLQLPLIIAVQPFKHLDNHNSTLPALLQDELTTHLSKQDKVRALATSAVQHAMRENYSPNAFYKHFAVDMLFEGSVREIPEGYQLNIRMVLAKKSITVWRDSITVHEKNREQLTLRVLNSVLPFIKKKVAYLESKDYQHG